MKGLYEAIEVADIFDTNCITPGTPFMKDLSTCLKYYISLRLSENPAWKNVKVLFSDSNVPGEGEHKIMDFIRNQRKCPTYNPNTRHVIYGLDADLIMLSLATHEPYFWILREDVFSDLLKKNTCFNCGQTGHFVSDCPNPAAESTETKELKPFVLLSIPILREYLELEFQEQKGSSDFDLERLIDDWIFLIFFVGNDFLPHLPSLEIREGAIDTLINIYKRNYMKLGGYLTKDGVINFGRAQIILTELGRMEDSIFRRRKESNNPFYFQGENRSKEYAARRQQQNSENADQETIPAKRKHQEIEEPEDSLRLDESGAKERYYRLKFQKDVTDLEFVKR